jgi:tetratricopeptide (TPR) repeat protein
VGRRLEQAGRTRALLVALLDVAGPRETKSYAVDDKGQAAALAEPSAEEQYGAAFRRWGLDADGTPEAEAVARLRALPGTVREEALAGLDAWMAHRRRDKAGKADWRRLRRLADGADDNETSRQLRALVCGEAGPDARAAAALLGGLTGPAAPWAALAERGRERRWLLAELRARAQEEQWPALSVVLLARAAAQAGDAAGAEAVLRQALARRPGQVVLLDALGRLLEGQGRGRLGEAVECFRAARAVQPRLGVALARALIKAGRGGEAEAVVRELLRRHPNNPELHVYLGYALYEQKELVEAVQAYRRAIHLRPDFPEAYYNLGNALRAQKELVEAVQAYRKAIQLRPDYPEAYVNLGAALAAQKELVEAVKAFRRAIDLRPEYASAYNGLGSALRAQKELVEAVQAFRRAIQLRPDFAQAHCNLGHALREQGRFPEALASYRRGHQLGSKRPGWPYPSAAWVAGCARLAELDQKLAAVRSGKGQPASPAEALELASLCRHPARRLHATAAHFAVEAFAAQPNLAGDLGRQPRYYAACSAALTAAGRAEDAKGLSEADRAGLRRQALAWLRADLAVHARWAQRGNAKTRAAVRQRLAHWLQDADLAAVRDQEALGRLPWGERAEWHHLWEGANRLSRQGARKD